MARHHTKEAVNQKLRSIMQSNKDEFRRLHTFTKSPEPKTKNKERVLKTTSEERLVGQASPK